MIAFRSTLNPCHSIIEAVETHSETNLSAIERGEVVFEGKTFKYKITPRTRPAKWTDLTITNDRGQSITIFFKPERQRLMKEIKRVLRLYKWIK